MINLQALFHCKAFICGLFFFQKIIIAWIKCVASWTRPCKTLFSNYISTLQFGRFPIFIDSSFVIFSTLQALFFSWWGRWLFCELKTIARSKIGHKTETWKYQTAICGIIIDWTLACSIVTMFWCGTMSPQKSGESQAQNCVPVLRLFAKIIVRRATSSWR